MVEQGPNVEWVRRARWVEDGSTWTSSGVAAGMDMTLAWIAKVREGCLTFSGLGADEWLLCRPVERMSQRVLPTESNTTGIAIRRGIRSPSCTPSRAEAMQKALSDRPCPGIVLRSHKLRPSIRRGSEEVSGCVIVRLTPLKPAQASTYSSTFAASTT